jgi:cyanophycinase
MPASTAAEERFPQPAMGPLVIVGGGLNLDNEPIFGAILGLRLGDGPICVLPIASDKPDQVAENLVRRFESFGGPGAAIGVQLKPGRANKPKIAGRLEECGGFFFTDGDPSRIVDTLRADGQTTLAEQAILRVNRRGGVIAGTGAGALVMSDPMIAGEDGSEDALVHGVSVNRGGPGLWIRGGMGFLKGGLTDQHYVAEGRTGRLLVALAALDGVDLGFGVDDDTALVIDGADARVVGSSQVVILEKVRSGAGRLRLDGSRFRVLMLGNGDGYNLMDGTAFVDARKDLLRLPDLEPVPPSGPWVARGLPLFIVDLAASPATDGSFDSRGYRFRLSKTQGFDSRAWEMPDGKNMPHGFTAGWFQLDITAIANP